MVDPRIERRLQAVVDRLRQLRRLQIGAIAWGAAALAVGLIVAGPLKWVESGGTIWTAVLGGVAAALGATWWAGRQRNGIDTAGRIAGDQREAARRVEQGFPELNSRLLTAIDLRPEADFSRPNLNPSFSFLQTEVIGEVLVHARSADWKRAVPPRRVWGAMCQYVVAMALFCAVSWWGLATPKVVDASSKKNASQLQDGLAAADELRVTVEPGDVQLERGSPLLVLARFAGGLPTNVTLVARPFHRAPGAEATITREAMQRSLSDPLFGGRLADVREDLLYQVEYQGRTSPEYRVTTFDFPSLVRADAVIDPPKYAGLPQQRQENTRKITAWEGSQLAMEFRLNKSVRSAKLVPSPGKQGLAEIVLAQAPMGTQEVGDLWNLVSTPLVDLVTSTDDARTPTAKYRLMLVDHEGRENRDTPEFTFTQLRHRTPEIQWIFPGRDLRISPLQELQLEGTVRADFGVLEAGLIVQDPDGDERVTILGADLAKEIAHPLRGSFACENLKVIPDQLISFHFYADDWGVDGQRRRTLSEMFFAEVRPFEEIYRQVPPMSGEGKASQKLIDLQRQVVSAVWNILRRERRDPPTKRLAENAKALSDSQTKVLELAKEVLTTLRDPLMREYLEQSMVAMEEAAQELQSAANRNTVRPLADARLYAQEAYQMLLKLQAREHLIMNASEGQGESAPTKDLNEQMKSLKLKNDRDRYETEKQAQDAAKAGQAEDLRWMNRLKELAQRQENLNERIRELDQEEESPAKKEIGRAHV